MTSKLTAVQSAALKLISERGAFPKIADWVPLDEFYKFVDALMMAVAPPVDSTHVLHDFVTHRNSWRAAILQQLLAAPEHAPAGDEDERSYWQHELNAYDNAMKLFDKHMPWLTVPNSCCENESRNINGGCDNCGAPCL